MSTDWKKLTVREIARRLAKHPSVRYQHMPEDEYMAYIEGIANHAVGSAYVGNKTSNWLLHFIEMVAEWCDDTETSTEGESDG